MLVSFENVIRLQAINRNQDNRTWIRLGKRGKCEDTKTTDNQGNLFHKHKNHEGHEEHEGKESFGF
jgi:hypothetical protein